MDGPISSLSGASPPTAAAGSSNGSMADANASTRTTRATGTQASAGGLTPDQKAIIAQLAATDRHVRAHEQAHLAAAGPFATSGASYTLVTGPDSRQYAVGGEVGLDTSPVPGDPAANAPADPSSQDKAVASLAAAMEQAAQLELAEQQQTAEPSLTKSALVKSAYGRESDAAANRVMSLTA
jgi:hypothetical protein